MKPLKLQSLLALKDSPWRHPWQVTPRYNGSKKRWEANINPSLVNGDDATISMALADAPSLIQQRLQSTINSQPSTSVDVRLSDLPIFPLAGFRSIGPDASPGGATENEDGSLNVSFEGVPTFFQNLGVGPPPTITSPGGSDTVTVDDAVAANSRLLRALDVVMNVDQPATATQVTVNPDTSAGAPIVQFSLTVINAPAARKLAYITLTDKFTPRDPPTPANLISGDYTGPLTDSFLLATVYLLSPAGAAVGSAPDMTWQAYVAHQPGAFWPLAHAMSRPIVPQAPDILTLDTGLAAGVGDSTNDFLLNQINLGNSVASLFLHANTLNGAYYNV